MLPRGALYILQRGVQWKQGVVVYRTLYTSLLYNTTPIHCTPHPLHPPLQSIHSQKAKRRRLSWLSWPRSDDCRGCRDLWFLLPVMLVGFAPKKKRRRQTNIYNRMLSFIQWISGINITETNTIKQHKANASQNSGGTSLNDLSLA